MAHPPDYHIHTRFSCDSEATMELLCRVASARGMTELAFTDHADFEPLDPCAGHFRPEPYWAAIRRCRRLFRDQLTIRAGVECGEVHWYREEVAALLSAHEYDVVLGSLHWVDGRPTFSPRFFDGLTLDEGVSLYLEELGRLAADGEYDVLAHMDIIRRATYRQFGMGKLDPLRYEAQIRPVLQAVAARGKGIEVNTSYLRKGIGLPGPSLQILRWFREEGGEIVTLGSDSHRAEGMGTGFGYGLAMIRAAGFNRLATFEKREVRWLHL